jgi:lysozyme
MQSSQRGIDLIKSFEGLRLKAYRDAVGILTIGYGHTGREVTDGLAISQMQAEDLLRGDLMRFEDGVRQHAGAATQNQFDAMVSLAFNVGVTAFANSTLVRKHRGRDFDGAADEFLRWNRAGGRPLPGLIRRRQAERRLYLAS